MKVKWIVFKMSGRLLKKITMVVSVTAETELEAKKEAFKIIYGYKTDKDFDAVDRRMLKAVRVDALEDGVII